MARRIRRYNPLVEIGSAYILHSPCRKAALCGLREVRNRKVLVPHVGSDGGESLRNGAATAFKAQEKIAPIVHNHSCYVVEHIVRTRHIQGFRQYYRQRRHLESYDKQYDEKHTALYF